MLPIYIKNKTKIGMEGQAKTMDKEKTKPHYDFFAKQRKSQYFVRHFERISVSILFNLYEIHYGFLER